MTSVVSKNNPPPPSDLTDQNIDEATPEGKEKERVKPRLVTTHLYLKPTHSTETLEKEIVLRRLRQRKRMSRLGKTVKALLNSAFAPKPDKASVHHKKWVDDPFASP